MIALTGQTGAEPATALYEGKRVAVDHRLADPTELWVTPESMERITGFVLKPEGACYGDICIPIRQEEDSDLFVRRADERWINLTKLAERMNQAVVHDSERNVWSFGPIPDVQRTYLQSAKAPEFELEDRDGNMVRLSDFRGKKLLLMTWASW